MPALAGESASEDTASMAAEDPYGGLAEMSDAPLAVEAPATAPAAGSSTEATGVAAPVVESSPEIGAIQEEIAALEAQLASAAGDEEASSAPAPDATTEEAPRAEEASASEPIVIPDEAPADTSLASRGRGDVRVWKIQKGAHGVAKRPRSESMGAAPPGSAASKKGVALLPRGTVGTENAAQTANSSSPARLRAPVRPTKAPRRAAAAAVGAGGLPGRPSSVAASEATGPNGAARAAPSGSAPSRNRPGKDARHSRKSGESVPPWIEDRLDKQGERSGVHKAKAPVAKFRSRAGPAPFNAFHPARPKTPLPPAPPDRAASSESLGRQHVAKPFSGKLPVGKVGGLDHAAAAKAAASRVANPARHPSAPLEPGPQPPPGPPPKAVLEAHATSPRADWKKATITAPRVMAEKTDQPAVASATGAPPPGFKTFPISRGNSFTGSTGGQVAHADDASAIKRKTIPAWNGSQNDINANKKPCLGIAPSMPNVGFDVEGRPFNLTTVVVNFANVGASYAKKVLKRIPQDPTSKGLFDWEGVRRCVTYLRTRLDLTVIGVVFENFWATDNDSPHKQEIPYDIRAACESIEETPRIQGRNHCSADDEMTIKCAYNRNCRYMDNDNYRDWKKFLRDPMCKAWLEKYQELLRMGYYFDSSIGNFDTLDGNVPEGLLASQPKIFAAGAPAANFTVRMPIMPTH